MLCPNISRIDQHGTVKVADFGLTQHVYDRNYFRHDKSKEGSEEKVPIRWMAPESIENGIYNEKTDVVCTRIIIMCQSSFLEYILQTALNFNIVLAVFYKGLAVISL